MATAPATFSWGANGRKITSPEQAARQRLIAEALMASGLSPAQNIGQGLADVTGALTGSVLNNEVMAAEEAGALEASGLFQGLGSSSPESDIIAALSNPWASDSQSSVAQALLGQQFQQNDPMNQLRLAQAQLDYDQDLSGVGSSGGKRGLTPIWGVDAQGNPVLGQMSDQGGLDVVPMPDGVTFGREPIRMDAGDRFVLLDPVTRQVIGEIPKSGNVPEGYSPDAETGALAPMAGGPQAQEVAAKKSKAVNALGAVEQKRSVVTQDIDRAVRLAGSIPSTGLWSLLNAVPGTPQGDLAGLLDTIEANVGFDALQEMRNNSPTGGALGSVTERELSLLAATVGSLRQSQSKEQFTFNLKRLKEQLASSSASLKEAFSRDFGDEDGGSEDEWLGEDFTGLPGTRLRKKSP
jgi:hypothetical protein